MAAIYTIAMGSTGFSFGTMATDWTNDVLFGEIVPPAVEGFLVSIGCADWLVGLINDGIVAGVGAVLGFVPQMLVLFLMLSILEDIGYMARVAFIMDPQSSASSASRARASSRCWWAPAAACPASWRPAPSRMSATAA